MSARFGSLTNDDSIARSKLLAPTSATSIELDVSGPEDIVAIWTAAHAATITITGDQAAGAKLILLVINDATLGRLMTLGTGFKPTSATFLGVTSKASTICFASDGTNFYEISRTIGTL